MKFLHNLPIKKKLTAITMLSSCTALMLACIALAVYEQVNIRKRLVRDVSSTAEMTGVNSAAGLTFNDPAAVEQTLKSLAAQPRIVRACVYGKDGEPFARYQRAGLEKNFAPPLLRADGHQFSATGFELFRGVDLGGEYIGAIFIETDLSEVSESLWRYAVIICVLLVGCSLVALLVGSRLQRIISQPIADLAETAAKVATERNYSVRAFKQSEDELGHLIDGFNHMLAQIQERDAALQKSHEELEQRVGERTQQLANSLSLTRATLEATADGILVADGRGSVTGFNENFIAIWNIPRPLVASGDEPVMLDMAFHQLKDPQAFLAKVEELYAHPEQESFDVLEFKDGRVFERYSKPQRIDDQSVGRVWSFRDVTQRKHAELKLEKAHQELLEVSRQAGMAEVATGVLHNVGNVLNSVNVASTCIADYLRKSKAANLSKVVTLFQDHAHDLGVYITEDPKGRQLPAYIASLSEHIHMEHSVVQKELAELQKHIDHIKDIVAMQQSFAKVSGVTETINVRDLVEDALRMNESSLARHDIAVVREYSEVPAITVEKHKAMQILVNLVRNSKQACEAANRDDKKMTIRVMHGADGIKIAVADNGIGISSENLTRIFAHGFTTKKSGHGFGLHSGALTAQELGGRLLVQSEGVGRGAVFTLELPIEPTRKKL